ncbi:LADA_0E06040g1_1 [Lachancea dasiensis]|uniref:LADA_0E06040g1_1 n=1 Tax=Lachancea dasiensis TaxID=1072105 RepID=A0A1G4JCE2_9SACH|nr:LADA_0E06040g1_1 [Lachancea dasiensis]
MILQSNGFRNLFRTSNTALFPGVLKYGRRQPTCLPKMADQRYLPIRFQKGFHAGSQGLQAAHGRRTLFTTKSTLRTIECKKNVWGTGARLMLKRSFHRGQSGSNFRSYNISPPIIILAFVGAATLLVVVIPFIFTFFFPLIIAGIAAFQYKKWKTSTLLNELHRSLKVSHMRINQQTIWGLQTRMFESLLNNNKFPAGMFRGVMDELKDQKMEMSEVHRQADQMLEFLKYRVLDAFKSNEQGIRDYFLGSDVSHWVNNGYELNLVADAPQTRGKGINGLLVMTISYPITLSSTNESSKVIAEAAIAFQDDSLAGQQGSFNFLRDLASGQKNRPMVISIRPTRTLSARQFILHGEDDDMAPREYSIRRTKDGRREFTYHREDSKNS